MLTRPHSQEDPDRRHRSAAGAGSRRCSRRRCQHARPDGRWRRPARRQQRRCRAWRCVQLLSARPSATRSSSRCVFRVHSSAVCAAAFSHPIPAPPSAPSSVSRPLLHVLDIQLTTASVQCSSLGPRSSSSRSEIGVSCTGEWPHRDVGETSRDKGWRRSAWS